MLQRFGQNHHARRGEPVVAQVEMGEGAVGRFERCVERTSTCRLRERGINRSKVGTHSRAALAASAREPASSVPIAFHSSDSDASLHAPRMINSATAATPGA
eukprot:scaffold3162_cov101-Isochrysis_galbana.AAC.7